jgi:hypothetical protein
MYLSCNKLLRLSLLCVLRRVRSNLPLSAAALLALDLIGWDGTLVAASAGKGWPVCCVLACTVVDHDEVSAED